MFHRLLKKFSNRQTGRATAKVHTLPAPVGGWNRRDSLSAMKPEDAIILDNIIPDNGRVRLRGGYLSWATDMAELHVETLMEYAPPDGGNKLFAAAPAEVYDVTTAGAASSAFSPGGTSARWQHTMFATTGGNFLCIVNGSNHYYTYDGSTWTNQAANVTGATSSTFVNVAVHANRLWFVQVDSLDAWYLETAAITGAATQFPLGPLCKKGGYLLAIGTWTEDGGDGSDDRWVGVTSKGEVIVYQGTDPSSADDWMLVGVYSVSEPIGRRCLIKVGGDIGIITSSGVALLSQLIGVNRSGQGKVAITNKIAGAFQEAYRQCGTSHGWQIVEFPSQSLVIINVPWQERVTAYQYVINIDTGAWCRFTGVNANCWSLLGDDLFFGTSEGKTYKFGEHLSDDGDPISYTIQLAYNKCGGPYAKVFQAARLLMMATVGYNPGVEIKLDYDSNPPNVTPPAGGTAAGPEWDVAEWDVADWGVSVESRSRWQSVYGEGRAVSVVLAGNGFDVTFEFSEVDVMYQPGGWL